MALFLAVVLKSLAALSVGLVLRGDDAKTGEYAKTAYRCLVVTEVAGTSRHMLQFETMLYPSFKASAALKPTGPSTCDVDLLAYCEPDACEMVARKCKLLGEDTSQPFGGCAYQRLPSSYESEDTYDFSTSLRFMSSEPSFRKVIEHYDYVMRTDVDAVLLPGVRSWVPPKGSAVGNGFMGTNFTRHRLESVAKQLGLHHYGIHGMQSTFYVRSSKIIDFSKLVINLTHHFYDNEFTVENCSEVAKSGAKCAWADWHQGVSSLYATDLAANHILGEPTYEQDQVTAKLDCGSTDNGEHFAKSADEFVQAHLLSIKFDLHGDQDETDFCSNARVAFPGGWYQSEYNESNTVGTYLLNILSASVEDTCGFAPRPISSLEAETQSSVMSEAEVGARAYSVLAAMSG